MQLKTRTWFLISISCFLLAGYFWHLGEERNRLRSQGQTSSPVVPAPEPLLSLGAANYHHTPALAAAEPAEQAPAPDPTELNLDPAVRANPLLTNRLSNTRQRLSELMRSDTAILLRNALYDTAGEPLSIPERLRAQGDPGSYLIQARGPLTEAFRAQVESSGAKIISYIPNNTYLVRLNEAGADQLRGLPDTQAVLAWEPYYKLDLRLLALALQEQPLPPGQRLSVLTYADARESAINGLRALGATVLAESRVPFGQQFIIQPKPESVAALAQLSAVQAIELHADRQLANDLTRVTTAVATNSITTNHYLGLTGSNVMVNVTDTGVDASHPDLVDRVFGEATTDGSGHGTHVAGIIASSGANGPAGTNAPGSTNGATFRGIAPASTIFTLPIDLLTGPLISDAYLQETAASQTNILISNNSWGYVGLTDYNLASASYDAAVRDALPGVTNSQPMVFVFAAGNGGGGRSDGAGGGADGILSPGNAKNVITVGALESPRYITNTTVVNGRTNSVFLAGTDSYDQVASFSSRGNTGIGTEGDFGRFKPDVVAPGTMIISCRATNWTDPEASVSGRLYRLTDQTLEARSTNFYSIGLPFNATNLIIRVIRNDRSPNVMPNINIHTNKTTQPAVTDADFAGANRVQIPVDEGTWWYALVNTNRRAIHFDVQLVVIETNDIGNYYEELKKLNDSLKPYYRYESGTSQAAAAASGTLALMQELFEQRLKITNSPAMMKALLINGARSLVCELCPTDQKYNLQVRNSINYQGWGLVSLTNSIPVALGRGAEASNSWPIALFDQDPARSLRTGQSHTYNVTLSGRAINYQLRATLVWTDPPGNPAAGIKLVNDLDLIVTNVATGEYYIGNNIPTGSDINEPSNPETTNQMAFDLINNVENVFINPQLDANYTVTVRARRVNVNAVVNQTNGILQDYALVISSGDTRLTNVFLSPPVTLTSTGEDPAVSFKSLTNRQALLDERVGANDPMLNPAPNAGVSNQWNFYVFTNDVANFTNVAILTFLPPNLSSSRFKEADIDLYVSPSGSITNLDPAVLATAWKSTTRGGSEAVILVNQAPTTYYIAVKSEDQQAASYGLYVLATDRPFGGEDENGNVLLEFSPMVSPLTDGYIPDGSPENPGWLSYIAVVANQATVRRVIIDDHTLDHEEGGDLFGNLSHEEKFVVLNNHRIFYGENTWIYDDSGEDDIDDSQSTDGPGSLRDFENEPAYGAWFYHVADNSLFHTGQVVRLSGYIEPQDDLTNNALDGLRLTVDPGKWRYVTVQAPVGVTNLITSVNRMTAGPLDLYIRRDVRPTGDQYDKYAQIQMPGGAMHYGIYDDPPLQPGIYSIGISNPTSASITFYIRVDFDWGLNIIETGSYFSDNAALPILDWVTTNSIISVTNDRSIADVKVGVRIDHPRLSDLTLHLVSPQGTRILLAENRGGLTHTNVPRNALETSLPVTSFGWGAPEVYQVPVASNGEAAEHRLKVDTRHRSGVISIDYDFINLPDDLRIYYDGRRIFNSGMRTGTGQFVVRYGPGVSTEVEVVVNEGNNSNTNTFWNYTLTITGPWNYATFVDKATLGDMLKFALPPYYTTPTNRVVLSNDFEGTPFLDTALVPPYQRIFETGDIFDGWRVVTNKVAVLTDTNWTGFDPLTSHVIAYTGSNCLALSHGTVRLGFTNLVPDREYMLSFVHRKVSNSPTQHMARAMLGNEDVNYGLGVPSLPRGASIPMVVPKLRAAPGQEVYVWLTNFPVHMFASGSITNFGIGDTNTLFNGFPLLGLMGCWSSHPTVLDSNTAASAPFLIGTNYLIHAPEAPGDYYLFLGVNDDDFTDRNNAPFEVHLRWQHYAYGSAEYALGSARIPFVSQAYWKAESLLFTANPTITNLTFRPGLNTTLLIDGIRIDEAVTTQYYQSEEPMTPFQGEPATGDWTLEVTDNRAGPYETGQTNAALLSWSLTFTFADYSITVPLTNGVAHTNYVRGDQMKYFVVSVPTVVTQAFNEVFSLDGSGVEWFYSPFGLPKGEVPPDPLPGMLDGTLTVNLLQPQGAELPPGRRYYIGVRNNDPTIASNAFVIQATFDYPVTPLVDGVPTGPVLLTNNIYPYLRAQSEPAYAISNMHYYYYDVPSNQVRSTRFELTSLNNDVQLVVRRALPVVDLFPHPTHFDYQSTEFRPMAQDWILVNSNSLPTALTPGRWYVGVYSIGGQNTEYSLVARSAPPAMAPLFNVTELREGQSLPFVVPGNSLSASFYRFAAQTNAALLIQANQMDGDVDVIVKHNDLPWLDLYDYSVQFPRATFGGALIPTESIVLRTNVFLPELAPGDRTNYFIALVNRSGGFVTGTLCASTFPVGVPVVTCGVSVEGVINPNGRFEVTFQTVSGNTYILEASSDLVVWTEIFRIDNAADEQRTVEDPTPVAAGEQRFYRLIVISPP